MYGATSGARCESKRLETRPPAGYETSQRQRYKHTKNVPEVSYPPLKHSRRLWTTRPAAKDDSTRYLEESVGTSRSRTLFFGFVSVHSHRWYTTRTSRSPRHHSNQISAFLRSLLPHVEYAIAPPNGILQKIGCVSDAPRIARHVRDKVVSSWLRDTRHRSSLWLLTRVAIQMSVDRSPLERASYKRSMLFFICCKRRKQYDTLQLSPSFDVVYASSTSKQA